jgi:hypothetical protein
MILPCVTCKIIIPHSGPALCVVPASAGTVAFYKPVRKNGQALLQVYARWSKPIHSTGHVRSQTTLGDHSDALNSTVEWVPTMETLNSVGASLPWYLDVQVLRLMRLCKNPRAQCVD